MAGKIQKVKGKAKEAVGDATGNKSLKREGKVDKTAGKTKNAVGKVADKVKGKR